MTAQRTSTNLAGRLLVFPPFRRLYEELDLVRKYGRFRPCRLSLPNSGHALFVNPAESRGRAILRCSGTGQPHLKAAWQAIVSAVAPDLAIDVGANYGEFLFGATYPPDARVIGVEANPRIQQWLERSRAQHPSRDRIELHAALVSDHEGEELCFKVDRNWSGRSSVLALPGRHVEEFRMKSSTVDALVAARPGPYRRVAFKIDVEGVEPAVLRGMTATLGAAERAAGLVEFNPEFLDSQGIGVSEYLEFLRRTFEIRFIGPAGLSTPGPDGGKGDLLLSTDPAVFDAVERDLRAAGVWRGRRDAA